MFCCNSNAKISSISQYGRMCCAQAQCGREALPVLHSSDVSWHGVAPVTSCILQETPWIGSHMVCPYPSLSIPCWSFPKETMPLCVSQAVFNLLAQSQSRGSEVEGLRETDMNRDRPHRHREAAARDADLE